MLIFILFLLKICNFATLYVTLMYMYVFIHWGFELQGNEQHSSSTCVNLAFRMTSVAYPEVLLLAYVLCYMQLLSIVAYN